MQTALFFSHRDRDVALRLLKWIGELGGCKGHNLLLGCNQISQRASMHIELAEEAAKHFDNVATFTPFDEDERDWPICCNHAWRSMAYHIRDQIREPWMWIEPDVTPRFPGWLDDIANEYVKGGKPFMGCDVDVPGSKRHMSGVGVYPAKVVAYCHLRRMPDLDREAWDMFFADEFLPHVHFTQLIQHIQFWPNYGDVPTFKDTGPEIHPSAVLFHRCKDGSLIERLRKERSPASVPVLEPVDNEPIVAPMAFDFGRLFDLERRVTEIERRLPISHCGPAANGVTASAAVQAVDEESVVSSPSLKPSRRRGKRMKQKKQRTPEQIQAAKERMAKARAARKPKTAHA